MFYFRRNGLSPEAAVYVNPLDVPYFVYGSVSLVLRVLCAARLPLFPAATLVLSYSRQKGRIKLSGSDFLKCFIDIFVYINSAVATPRNKIKHHQTQWSRWEETEWKSEKILRRIVRLFWPFITCPVLSKTSLNYFFFPSTRAM